MRKNSLHILNDVGLPETNLKMLQNVTDKKIVIIRIVNNIDVRIISEAYIYKHRNSVDLCDSFNQNGKEAINKQLRSRCHSVAVFVFAATI